MRILPLVLPVVLLAACGSAAATHTNSSATIVRPAPAAEVASAGSCPATVAATVGEVGQRIYHEAASGPIVAEAVERVQGSAALAAAAASGSESATRAALQSLLAGQIARIEVLRGGRVLATAGSGSAIAPVRGPIPGTDASYVLSIQADTAYLRVAQQITGAQVLLLAGNRRLSGTVPGPPPAEVPSSGPLQYGGTDYEVFSLAGATFPSGPLRIAMLMPSGGLACPGPAGQTRVETLGRVGERIYQEELHSADVAATVRSMERSTVFQDAVAAHDPAATHAAIDDFFKAHIHVVRVRVMIGSELLVDVGGPYALAPVHGTLRRGGKVIGTFSFAIQDDAGYVKLAHRFTGAEVLMRRGATQVMGSLQPGPASVPDRGEVSYGGQRYQAFSFLGEAFPSGPLRISLLIPS